MRSLAWKQAQTALRAEQRHWLVSGAAGFIGSHLVEALLELGQQVVGFDNFSSGRRSNLLELERRVSPAAWKRFRFLEGELRDPEFCRGLCAPGTLVLHQAALGSVPRSLEDPGACFGSNVRGFFNLLEAARQAGAGAFVYASSSSVYGAHPDLPRREPLLGALLSPYAGSKRQDEIMAQTSWRCYGQGSIGLRYFNVFGARQDPAGAYSAVIPRWAECLLAGEQLTIHGDGSNSRDFCPVSCVVQANLLAALAGPECQGKVYNVALGQSITLLELSARMAASLGKAPAPAPRFGPARPADVSHSLADLAAIRSDLGYEPEQDFDAALAQTLAWYASEALGGGTARATERSCRSAGSPGEP